MVPSYIFRIVLHASDLDGSARFYGQLLGTAGRRIAPTRHYFDCGAVILGLLDASAEGGEPVPQAEYVYFATDELESVWKRAADLGCLSGAFIHGAAAGEIVTRPWGERSFYAADPLGNGLCFVDDRTLFTGG